MSETHNLLAALALLGVYLMLIPMKALPAVFPYEFLLFAHHSMSAMIGYAIWCHIPADNNRTRVFLYGIGGIFLSSFAFQTAVTLYRNHFWFQSVSLSKNGSFDYIQVQLKLRKPVKVEPGQYINLWVPLGPISSIQSHPFTVANWSPEAQKELKLFVEVNSGLTKTLRDRVELELTSNIGIFTGPYGRRIPVENYETVILIATGLGVVALTPYLQWLVHAARMREVRIAPVHLVWQISSWKQSHTVFDVIDFALALDEREDDLGDGKEAGVLSKTRPHAVKISMYYEEEEPLPPKVQLFIKDMKKKEEEMGGKTRVKVYECQLPLMNVLLSETVMSPTHGHSGKPTLIAASVPRIARNTLVEFARENSRAVDLVLADYQP
ncbi:hypothetical protein BHE90_009558 [Fusarium euwallaceae]|uniref:ferric-chelate reductase (NADPH) n=1 Tax=Fusarium euwallaceae TaxID=1147111 RepID=A0A430LJV2_9HYPO|nr:hypothetical protein BHE90_009558 [Fusarium euwallaceae]